MSNSGRNLKALQKKVTIVNFLKLVFIFLIFIVKDIGFFASLELNGLEF